jgi:HK97 family phage prohead protease
MNMETIMKHFDGYAEAKGFTGDVLRAVASTARIDRDGERILPSAFVKNLDTYKRNPVILSNHTHRSADGRPTIIGSAQRIDVTDAGLDFDMSFATIPIASEWKTLFQEGHARSFSVGFIPKKGAMETLDGRQVYTHHEVELIEISAVGVPSNPDAVVRGIDPDKVAELIDKLAVKFDALAALLNEYKLQNDDIKCLLEDLALPEKGDYEEALLHGDRTKFEGHHLKQVLESVKSRGIYKQS